MANTTVASLVDQASVIIQDRTNIRWNKYELLDWLNESYKQIVLVRPDANTKTELLSGNQDITSGSKQEIPKDGVSFITLTRNSNGTAIRRIAREVLDDQVEDWHGALSSDGVIDHFVYDAMNPRVFYVYPNASSSKTAIELVYSAVPEAHISITGTIKLDDRYAPAILDYILYRAYQKDADYAANDNRSVSAYNTFINSIGASPSATTMDTTKSTSST